MPESPDVTTATAAVNGTSLHYERRGAGMPVLLIHGGGEDSSMLVAQAEALADAGYDVITYDRRGTGESGREDWPGNGPDQHADDAAALLLALGAAPATVVGLSSGGVVALELAAQHPDAVSRVIAWEVPAAGVVPGGAEFSAQLMEPVTAHLAEHPGDYVGAQAILLSFVLGFDVSVDDPAFAAARLNAEAMVRDDPTIVLEPFVADDLAGRDLVLAVGDEPNELVAGASAVLAELAGITVTRAAGPHEVYLSDPSVLVELVGSMR